MAINPFNSELWSPCGLGCIACSAWILARLNTGFDVTISGFTIATPCVNEVIGGGTFSQGWALAGGNGSYHFDFANIEFLSGSEWSTPADPGKNVGTITATFYHGSDCSGDAFPSTGNLYLIVQCAGDGKLHVSISEEFGAVGTWNATTRTFDNFISTGNSYYGLGNITVS